LEIEKKLLVADLRCDWETYNYGVRLLGKLTALAADVSLGDYRPTDVADEVFGDVQTRIDEQITSFERLVAADLPAFNARLADELVPLDRLPQQCTRADDVLVTDDLRQVVRPHARGKRRRLLEGGATVGFKQIHGDLVVRKVSFSPSRRFAVRVG
jgi:hypothetical protein